MTSDSMLLHRAAYGLRATACCRANSLPSAAASSKSARASSPRHASLRRRPLCTSAWHAVRPALPLKVTARSRSPRAPEGRQHHSEAHTRPYSWFSLFNVLQAYMSVSNDIAQSAFNYCVLETLFTVILRLYDIDRTIWCSSLTQESHLQLIQNMYW